MYLNVVKLLLIMLNGKTSFKNYIPILLWSNTFKLGARKNYALTYDSDSSCI